MREILFKAKLLDNGKWVEGYYLKYVKPLDGEIEHRILASDSYGVMWYAVHGDTICQYTGLTDKNGKCVFEWDIVKHYNKISIGEPDKYIIAAIRWEECKARFIQDTEDGIYAVYDSSVFEVIGNIFDNPELLENE